MATLLKSLLQKIAKEVYDEVKQNDPSAPEEGTIVSLDDDGTVTVQTASTQYSGIGTPILMAKGAYVIVLTADGKKVALPSVVTPQKANTR